jgi:hypothetical protein
MRGGQCASPRLAGPQPFNGDRLFENHNNSGLGSRSSGAYGASGIAKATDWAIEVTGSTTNPAASKSRVLSPIEPRSGIGPHLLLRQCRNVVLAKASAQTGSCYFRADPITLFRRNTGTVRVKSWLGGELYRIANNSRARFSCSYAARLRCRSRGRDRAHNTVIFCGHSEFVRPGFRR